MQDSNPAQSIKLFLQKCSPSFEFNSPSNVDQNAEHIEAWYNNGLALDKLVKRKEVQKYFEKTRKLIIQIECCGIFYKIHFFSLCHPHVVEYCSAEEVEELRGLFT
jgi:hypothetical protein